jgi:hypothetical protein
VTTHIEKTPDTLDALDLQRLGLLTLTVMEMSSDHDIRIRRSKNGVHRVDVMYKNFRQTTHSKATLLEAMELTLERLQHLIKPLGHANARIRFVERFFGSLVLVGALAWSAAAQAWTCNPALGSGQPSQCTTTFDSRTLPDGPHTITVRAYNAAGAMVEDSVTVTVDNTPPVVVITRPTPQATYKAEGVTPAGSAIDVTTAVQAVTATLNGLAMPVTRIGTAWSMAPITKNGGHTLIVTARDSAGNLKSQTVRFKIVGGK